MTLWSFSSVSLFKKHSDIFRLALPCPFLGPALQVPVAELARFALA